MIDILNAIFHYYESFPHMYRRIAHIRHTLFRQNGAKIGGGGGGLIRELDQKLFFLDQNLGYFLELFSN